MSVLLSESGTSTGTIDVSRGTFRWNGPCSNVTFKQGAVFRPVKFIGCGEDYVLAGVV